MKRLESWTRERKKEIRARLSEWEGVFGLDDGEAFFGGSGTMPDFRFPTGEFCVETAWWLGELCRLAYTPDHREVLRDKKEKLPRREILLQERSPFVEELSVHKTGNHASIYRRRDGEGGTIVCFRGTNKTRQWIMNAVARPHGWKRFRSQGDPEDAFVHSGFYVFFKRIWPRMIPTLETLPRPWVFTGHSLGGALATIAGAVEKPELVCTFGAPKVGSQEFHRLKQAGSTWRIVNDKDLVPRLPLPDPKLADRQFVHGTESIRLTGSEVPGTFASLIDEGALPFDLKSLAREFETPPAWIREHRMSEYLRRLRRIHDFRQKK
ncbi:MAG: lipase family protein [Verrucomicrobiales bacterium]|nr:lipase family protein [Verrucomicrobiales bacterium]